MNSVLEMDNNSRDKIRTELNTNFFVEAGAGSGKTTILVDRMVAMVESGIDVAEISAITFTKAAANEFYSRFQEELTKRANKGNENAKRALENIDMCFMGTIDSFCHMILSAHPVDADVPANISIVNNSVRDEFKNVFNRIAKKDEGYEHLYDKYKAAISINSYKPEEMFASLMQMVLESRYAEYKYNKPFSEDVDTRFSVERKRIIEILKYLDKNHEAMARLTNNNTNRLAWAKLQESIKKIDVKWSDNIGEVIGALFNCNNLDVIKEYESMDELGPGWERYIVPRYKDNKSGPTLDYYSPGEDSIIIKIAKELSNQRFAVMADLVNECKSDVSDSLRKEGKLTFTDCLLYTRNLLREDAKRGGSLIEYINKRHKYYFIDEFQDTSPIQIELFFYLTAEKPVEDWEKCKPRPGSLFIVGDPKQSIYRFRNADISSYMRIKDLFVNDGIGETLELTRNYRSSEIMTEYFNDTFAGMFPDATSEIQCSFSEIPIDKTHNTEGSLQGVFKYNKQSNEPERVAEIIKHLVGNDDITIQVKKESRKEGDEIIPAKPRPVRYRDIMLIAYTTTNLKQYITALANAQIPYRIAGDTMFDNCPSLLLLYYVLSSITDYDRKALVPQYVVNGDIEEYKTLINTMPLSAFAATILEEEKVLMQTGTDNVEYLFYALELLRAREMSGDVNSLQSGLEFLRRLIYNSKEETERAMQLSEEADSVYIANLHKVKGLEAPIVMLLNHTTKAHSVKKRVDYTSSNPATYIFELDDYTKNYVYLDEREKEKEIIDAEGIRLLYVAATRAANVLIIGSRPTKSGEHKRNPWNQLASNATDQIENFLKKYDSQFDQEVAIVNVEDGNTTDTTDNTMLEMSVDTGGIEYDEKEVNKVSAEELYKEGSSSSSRKLGVRNKEERAKQDEETYGIITPSKLPRVKPKHKSDENNDGADADSLNNFNDVCNENKTTKERSEKGDPRVIGTMIHELMETIVMSGNRVEKKSLINEIIENYKDQLSLDPEDYQKILSDVFEIIQDGGYGDQEAGVVKNILTELLGAEEVYCELPFCYKEEAGESVDIPTIWRGTMDVVYKKDGKWHILDYKTNYENENLSDEYAAQLDAYKKAFKVITGEEADAKIYSIPV